MLTVPSILGSAQDTASQERIRWTVDAMMPGSHGECSETQKCFFYTWTDPNHGLHVYKGRR